MNSNNPRLERLKELMALEERRVAVQQQLESITDRMSSLRDSLFDGGASTPAKAPAASAPRAVAAPAPRSRGGRPKRAARGALKEQIVTALRSAGSSGVRVTELAKALGMKPVNIHSWFHSSIKRYPEIKKIKGGHYRLQGSLGGSSSQPAQRDSSAKAASSASRTTGRKTASTARKGASGGRRGALSEKILGELQKAGPKGISVREIASKIGANYRNIFIWFATTGKRNAKVKKIAPAQYRLLS